VNSERKDGDNIVGKGGLKNNITPVFAPVLVVLGIRKQCYIDDEIDWMTKIMTEIPSRNIHIRTSNFKRKKNPRFILLSI
jgi:hypothetical protein